MADPRVIVSDLSGTVTLARDTITLERIWASLNGGDAEISGTVRQRWFVRGGSPAAPATEGSIVLHHRHGAYEASGLQAEADADLTLALEPRGQLLTGTVTLVRSAYREPLSVTGGLLQALRSSGPSGAPTAPSPFDSMRLDVRVVTGSDLIVDNNYAQLTASADLRVGGTASQPVPTGSITLGEGGVVFFGGNRYRLEGPNSIDFTNPGVLEPDLHVAATRRVSSSDGQVEITLELTGTPATLETTLTSDHPHLSQADLASLLVTGRKVEEAGSYTPGAEELLGFVSGELFGTAARAVGLDVIRVERGTPDVSFDAGLVATETDPGARLTFGKNIGARTEVVFSQSLRESGALTWIVRYAPRTQIKLGAVSLDNGDRLYDFRLELLFGRPPSRSTAAAAAPSRVGEVRISGAGADEDALRSHLRLAPGDRFNFFHWQDDRDRLEQFYHDHDRAEARVVTRRTEGAGMNAARAITDISYDVRPGPHTTIVIDGFTFPRRVIDSIRTAWSRVVIDEFLIDEAQTIVRGELVDRGFVEATVSATAGGTADQKQLRVMVDRGPHVRRRRVVFEGNRAIASERLRNRIRSAGLDRALWLNPDRVRDALIALYQSEGYLNASAAVDPLAIEGSTASRTIRLSEGEPFRVRELQLEGVHALPSADVAKASALAAGEVLSDASIDRARRGIAGAYRAAGFNSVAVTLRTGRIEGRPEVDVAVTIEEGPQQRLRDVVTAGFARTRPELVSRQLKLEPGQPVNLAAWSSARRRVYETGAFRSIDIQPEPALPGDAAGPTEATEQPVRARVTVEEWPAVRVRYGLEIEDQHAPADDPSRAQLLEPAADTGRTFGVGAASEVTVQNLFGHGLSAGVAGRYTRDFRAARTFLTAPSVFGWPVRSNVYFSQSHEQLGESGTASGAAKFAVDLTDITLEQRVRLLPPLAIAYVRPAPGSGRSAAVRRPGQRRAAAVHGALRQPQRPGRCEPRLVSFVAPRIRIHGARLRPAIRQISDAAAVLSRDRAGRRGRQRARRTGVGIRGVAAAERTVLCRRREQCARLRRERAQPARSVRRDRRRRRARRAEWRSAVSDLQDRSRCRLCRRRPRIRSGRKHQTD